MSAISPARVLAEVSAAVPEACRENIVVIGSLAAGYHFFRTDPTKAVRTKDVDCVLVPFHAAVGVGQNIARQLLDAGWKRRMHGDHQEPGTANEDSLYSTHRHMMHEFAAFPGRAINPYETPELNAAAIKTLIVRGDGATGWSKAWRASIHARLLQPELAYRALSTVVSGFHDNLIWEGRQYFKSRQRVHASLSKSRHENRGPPWGVPNIHRRYGQTEIANI